MWKVHTSHAMCVRWLLVYCNRAHLASQYLSLTHRLSQRHTLLKGLSLGRRNGLDDTEELRLVGYISKAHFTILCPKFQPVTICNRFKSFFRQSVFQYLPIIASVFSIWELIVVIFGSAKNFYCRTMGSVSQEKKKFSRLTNLGARLTNPRGR